MLTEGAAGLRSFRLKAPSTMLCLVPLSASGEELNQSALLYRRCDEAGEQRMRVKWFGFEFGVELHPDEPGMVGPFDNFG